MFYYFHHVLKKHVFRKVAKVIPHCSVACYLCVVAYLLSRCLYGVCVIPFQWTKSVSREERWLLQQRLCCPVSAGLVCKRRQFFHERVRLSVVSDGGVHPTGNEAQCFVEIFLGG